MDLEQEIKQKEFRNENQKALLNIIYTNNFLVGKMNEIFKKFHITRQQFNVLRIIRGQNPKPVTINLIKDRMLDKMSDASRIVERLRKKGLIQKKQSKDDRRAAEIIISKNGLDLLEKMDGSAIEFENLVSNLTDWELQTLDSLLNKIRN